MAPAAGADSWFESYEKAEKALGEERWTEAVEHLNAALEENPRPGSNVRTYGMRFIEYYPYLKLGIAYYGLGQADAALQAFETEENKGAIADSETAMQMLARFRQQIRQDQTRDAQQRGQRADAVVGENLAKARSLAETGKLDEALAAIGRVLAVVPEHAEGRQLRTGLIERLRRQQLRQEEDRRWEVAVAAGRAAVDAESFEEAAAQFRQALGVRDDPSVRTELEKAQQGLRRELEQRDAAEQSDLAGRAFADALAAERRGDFEQALMRVQSVLALEPENLEAASLQARALASRDQEAGQVARSLTLDQLLAAADRLLREGDVEAALRSVNRALALDPVNERALQQVANGYRRLSDRLLKDEGAPPVIVLDQVTPLTVDEARLVLIGTVYDSTSVALEVLRDGAVVGEPRLTTRQLQGVWITSFRVDLDLQPGPSSWVVAATDEDGNRAAEPLAIDYRVPFVSSRWFPAAVTAGAGLIALCFVIARRIRRARQLRDRFNPYVAGAPILQQERFFGRQQLLEYVLRRISNNSVMLYGERRIGKTSFQHRLKQTLLGLNDPDHEFFPVFIDLQGIPQERFFATLAAEVFHELAPKLGGIEPSRERDDDFGYREFVKDLHRVLKLLKERTTKKVKLVLLIDEVDELNDYDPRVNQRLRSVFMRAFADNLVAVVSGVAIKKHWEREGSPWYNFFQEIEVVSLDPEEARSLIEAPVRGVFTFEKGTADEIIRRTQSKPYLIQRVCSALVDRMHSEHRRRILAGDVEDACRVEGL